LQKKVPDTEKVKQLKVLIEGCFQRGASFSDKYIYFRLEHIILEYPELFIAQINSKNANTFLNTIPFFQTEDFEKKRKID